MIFFIIFLIAVISVALSFWSLKREIKKTQHEKHVEKELAKGKVLFYSPSEPSSSSDA